MELGYIETWGVTKATFWSGIPTGSGLTREKPAGTASVTILVECKSGENIPFQWS